MPKSGSYRQVFCVIVDGFCMYVANVQHTKLSENAKKLNSLSR